MSASKFFEKQWKSILGIFGIIILVGGAFVLYSMNQVKKEKQAQEAYFLIEKKFYDLKNKKNNPEANAKKETVDFDPVKEELNKFLATNKETIAGQMAALLVSEIHTMKHNDEEALATLRSINGKKGLVSLLIQQKIGQLLADQGKCQDAIAEWQKIIDRKEAAFIHSETKIQQALCYTSMNDYKKAEELLTTIANQQANPDMSNSSVVKDAEKYLRLINFKKAHGS